MSDRSSHGLAIGTMTRACHALTAGVLIGSIRTRRLDHPLVSRHPSRLDQELSMEFGVFLNGYIPGPAAHISELEHEELMREAEYVIFADKHNWKYAWLGEHHALTEYSHMSAPEVVMGYIAGHTDYIHLSTGINSLSPRKEHPVRMAERAAMLDHVTNRRYEWGTGRGAGSHEMASFNILDTNSTKAEGA